MGTLDTRPEHVEAYAYAGDTFTITIVAPSALVSGMVWKAELRSSIDAVTVDATFDITEPTVADGPAYIVLDSATTRLLASTGVLQRVKSREGKIVEAIRYNGIFDCQISNAGTDPVRTLVKGTLAIDQDVTRE